MSQLVTNVHVAASGHQSQWFGPGDDIPAWAFEKLRHNPLLWDELPDDEPADDSVKSSVAADEYVLNAAATDDQADLSAWLEAEDKYETAVAEWLDAEEVHVKAEAELAEAKKQADEDLKSLNDELNEKPKPAPAKKAPARKAPAKKAAPKTAE